MNRDCLKNPTRRDLLTTGAAAIATLQVTKLAKAAAPASSVAIVRCRTYQDFGARLASACDQIGGIGKLARGKTVAIKLNLTGNPKNWPLTPDLPYRTDPTTVIETVHLLAKAGARRVRIIESFFPATEDLALWARYGLDVNAINNLGVPVVWENVQNLGRYKQYVRLKVPTGGYMYPAYHLNPAFTECDTLRFVGEVEEPLDKRRDDVDEEQLRRYALLVVRQRLRRQRKRAAHQRTRQRTASGNDEGSGWRGR